LCGRQADFSNGSGEEALYGFLLREDDIDRALVILIQTFATLTARPAVSVDSIVPLPELAN